MLRRALLTAALAGPATAQVIPTGSPAADILLSQAIAEHRLFLACSVLDPVAHAAIAKAWQADVAAATRLLADHKAGAEAIAAFAAAASTDLLLPAPDTPFADVRTFCDQHPDWASRYAAGDVIRLADSLPQALP
jgi:hypothetical protein